MCLGMAKRCHVIGIVYRRGSKVKYNTCQDVGAEPRDLTSEMKDGDQIVCRATSVFIQPREAPTQSTFDPE